MKEARMLGMMIQKNAVNANISKAESMEIFHCNEKQMQRIMQRRVFPSYGELKQFAERSGTTVSAIFDGDEEYYDKHIIPHCYGEFRNKEAREEVLDIIDMVLTLEEATDAKANQKTTA